MRALLVILLLGGCTPEIVAGAYLCGPNEACPEGQACSELDNTCVLPGRAEPFVCDPDVSSEPDDSAATAYALPNIECVTLPAAIESCMPVGDPADWIKLTAPVGCPNISLETSISFPLAFQRLGIELWDLGANQKLATDIECELAGTGGNDLRCLTAPLTAGTTYGLQIAPTGEGDCDGRCAFNRYTVRIQLAAP